MQQEHIYIILIIQQGIQKLVYSYITKRHSMAIYIEGLHYATYRSPLLLPDGALRGAEVQIRIIMFSCSTQDSSLLRRQT